MRHIASLGQRLLADRIHSPIAGTIAVALRAVPSSTHAQRRPGRSDHLAPMKEHANIGGDLPSSIRFLYPAVPIARHHRESWNGTRYPSGIGGIDIPRGATILSAVDCFDALTSDRSRRIATRRPMTL
jgi:response regulator RpfG family c-di-GMP phosphodiesterase